MTRLLLALSLVTLTACKGSPFDPWGHTPIDECHPEQWLDTGARSHLSQAEADSLASYQRACQAAREARN